MQGFSGVQLSWFRGGGHYGLGRSGCQAWLWVEWFLVLGVRFCAEFGAWGEWLVGGDRKILCKNISTLETPKPKGPKSPLLTANPKTITPKP